MRGYLNIYYKKNINIHSETIINIINNLKDHRHHVVHNHSNKIDSYYYTNENPNIINYIKDQKYYFTCLVGQYMTDELDVVRNIETKNEKDLDKYISNLSGVFNISNTDFNVEKITVFSHVSRIENSFYVETDSRIIVGTDPIIVSAIANDDLKPEFDITNAPGFLTQGHFTDETTFFKNVKAIPANSKLTIMNNKFSINYIDDTFNNMGTVKPNKNIMDDLKSEYLNTFQLIPNIKNLNIGITGGKDSRLALLGLLHNEFDVKTVTRGFADHPDVIIAKQMAEILGIKHSVVEPKLNKEKNLDVNPLEKSLASMKATSGQVYGYENIPYSTEYKGNIGVTGVAALTIKGGYLYLNDIKPKHSSTELKKRFSGMDNFLVEGAVDNYHNFIDEFAQDDFQKTQLMHAILYMNGRWTSDTRLAKNYTSDIYSPFYDNKFIKKIIQIEHKYLANGFVQYTLTKKLNSEVANLPLAADRWPFEKNGPLQPKSFGAWIKRAPQYSSTKLGNYNWRQLSNDDGILKSEIREILLSTTNHELFNVVSYKKLEDLLNSDVKNKYNKFIWSCLSIHAYSNYLKNDFKARNNIRLFIPETNIETIKNTTKLVDFTDSIESLNKAVQLKKIAQSIEININKDSNLNRYIKLFDGNFTNIPKNIKSNIENVKEIKLNLNIESVSNIKMKLFMIYYNETGQVKKDIEEIIIKKDISNFIKKFTVPSHTKYFRIAINIPGNNKIDKFKINYFYGEIFY